MTKTDVFVLVQKNILEILNNLTFENIKPDISMHDLGANSIDRVDVIVKTMADLSLKVPLVDFGHARKIGELVDTFYEKLENKGAVH